MAINQITPESFFTPQQIIIGASSGFIIGILAGLVGLGGAEERIPFILYGIQTPLYDMVVANLVISFATSGFNLILRANLGLLTQNATNISLAMIVGSLAGAYFGAVISHRLDQKKMKALLIFVLSLVIIRLAADVAQLGSPSVFPGSFQYPLAVFFGLLIGIVSGTVGVAGGEYRIPVLLYGFGIPLKVAGTASQLVSLPTMLTALVKHRTLHPFSQRALRTTAVMGIPSLLGVAISGLLLNILSVEAIETVFISLLLYTITRLSFELARPSEE